MAILINGMLKGRLGNQVFSIINGQNYVRPVRKNGPPTEAMKARQELFARAGKLCKALKLQINEHIKIKVGYNIMCTKMMSSLVYWITAYCKGGMQKGNTSEYFYDCDFTSEKTLRNTLRVPLEFSIPEKGLIQLKIKSFNPIHNIVAPHYTSQVECKIVAAGALAIDGTPTGSVTEILHFDYNDRQVAEQVIDLQIPTPEGALIVIAMSLQYKLFAATFGKNNHNATYAPAGIVHALYV